MNCRRNTFIGAALCAAVMVTAPSAAFEAIDADYGSLETYLRDGIGLDATERAALAARYLQA